MPRPKRTLHFTFVKGEPPFEIKDWTKIESAYGSNLPEPVRSEIHHITWLYLLRAQCERAAVPVSDVANLISSVRREAEQLQAALLEASQLHHGAAAAVVESFSEGPLKITAVTNLMSSLVCCCELSEAGLTNSTLPGYVVWEAWGWWVRELTKIMKRHSLGCEAGKNWDGKPDDGTMSSFTAFITAIEDDLPKEYRRFGTSGARTQAIHRAQRGEI